MESTAINTVYAVIKIVSENERYADIDREYDEGWLMEVFAREDNAKEFCDSMNKLERDYKDKIRYWKVCERRLI